MKFSVSLCVYGGDDPIYFERALDSVFLQSRKPDEVVLAVDGPISNEHEKVIEKYNTYPIFKVVRLEENKGHGEARRLTVSNCTMPIVAIMDSDDIALPDRFEKQIAIFEKDQDIDLCGGQIEEFIGDESNIIDKRSVPEKEEDIVKYMKYRCPFNQQTVAFKREMYDKAGGYLDWHLEEDYYLWVRMYLCGAKFINLPDTLVLVRMSADSYKRRGGWKYYKSEKSFQKYLLKHGIISRWQYMCNVFKRFVVQVLMPGRVRSFVFKKFAREKAGK